jgi:hypothetical protein
MKITFSPTRSDLGLTLSYMDETLSINGEPYDFSGIPEGATLPQGAVECAFLVSDVSRKDGVLELALILPHGADAPPETLFPAPVLVTQDGPIPVPPYQAPDEETQV